MCGQEPLRRKEPVRGDEVAGQRTSKRTHGGGLLASSVRRALLILLAITGWSLGGTDPILFAREERGPDSSVAIPLILSAPEAYEGKTVIIRGTVEAVETRRVSFIRMTSGLEQERNHAP